MALHDYLSDEQIKKIVNIISITCERAAQKDSTDRMGIDAELFARLKKGRKAHDVTGDINVALFKTQNVIEGLNLSVAENGIYAQPELENERVLIHIYHRTNRLDSKLVKDRANGVKAFFCIRYNHDKEYHLLSVESVYVPTNEVEKLYSAPRLIRLVGKDK